MAPGCKNYLDTFSSFQSPPRRSVFRTDGVEQAVLLEADRIPIEEYDLQPAQIGGELIGGRVAALRLFAERFHHDVVEVARQFRDSHSLDLVGTADPENLKRNVQWLDEPMDQELYAQVFGILEPVRNQTWLSGRPENN